MCALCSKLLAVLGTGLVIKTMDDLLDEKDVRLLPYLRVLGPGVIAYSAAVFSLALALDFQSAFGLFWASYSLGMLKAPKQKLPTLVKAWGEIILGVILMLIFLGAFQSIWSLLIIGAVHLADDLVDFKRDKQVKAANTATKIGRLECFLLTLILLYGAVSLSALDSIVVWVLALVIGNAKIFRMEDARP